MNKFEEILGKGALLSAIEEKGFEEPSEIQSLAMPLILAGNDVIGIASTGSGKTLAFSSGLIKNVKKDYGIQGLVLTPTRELADQVSKEIAMFSKENNIKVVPIYGGVSYGPQERSLKSAEIIVATPGRLLDHLEKRTIDLSRLNTLVLDEADRMFDMGFREDVIKIISACPIERQTLLFSATTSADVGYFSEKYMRNPKEVAATPQVDPSKLKQIYYDVQDSTKFSLLVSLLKAEDSGLVIIFCNTRRNVDFVTKNLSMSGVEAVALHGGHTQDKRNKVMDQFHSNSVHVLVATDVAARGLDIKGVSHVYNYDIPINIEEYTHRIGRTARAGEDGKVINLVASRDYEGFRVVMSGDFNIERLETPEVERVHIKWIPERKGRFRGSRGAGRSQGGSSGNRGRNFGRDSNNNGRNSRGRDSRGRDSRGSGGRDSGRGRRDSRGRGRKPGFHSNKGRSSGGRDRRR